jgi:3-hydroxyisobutyrate dehydrogenase-like beta-hydroxyacid dehydrogenase
LTKVAILYPGEMGAAFGRVLHARGAICATVVGGRSEATRRRAGEADIVVCPSMVKAVEGCTLIVSLVPARAGQAVAAQVAEAFDAGTVAAGAQPLYLDANSTAPADLADIAGVVEAAGLTCVDGAVFGPASRVGQETITLLSGPDAARAAALLSPAMAVRVVGPALGQASALKLALAVVTKGVVALGIEALSAVRAAGADRHAAELLAELYPGIWDLVRRVMPSYPRHVARRRAEVEDAATWIEAEGLPAPMARATAEIFARVEAAGLDAGRDWSVDAVIDAVLAAAAR